MATWTNQEKHGQTQNIYGFLLLENGAKLTLEDQYFIIISEDVQVKRETSWTNQTKN